MFISKLFAMKLCSFFFVFQLLDRTNLLYTADTKRTRIHRAKTSLDFKTTRHKKRVIFDIVIGKIFNKSRLTFRRIIEKFLTLNTFSSSSFLSYEVYVQLISLCCSNVTIDVCQDISSSISLYCIMLLQWFPYKMLDQHSVETTWMI